MAVIDILIAGVRRIGASVACLRRREADAVSVMVVVMGMMMVIMVGFLQVKKHIE
mgnify:CR=1 FL=1